MPAAMGRQPSATLSQIVQHVHGFFKAKTGAVFRNEANLQHQLGLFLRDSFGRASRVDFEYPVPALLPNAPRLVKKEIDLVVIGDNPGEVIALELKCPRRGQHPEQMFKVWQDLQFLEQLTALGCDGGVFAIHVIDPLFSQSGSTSGIYKHFRTGAPLMGKMRKPTGARDIEATLVGTYTPTWVECGGTARYWVQGVSSVSLPSVPVCN